MRVIRNIREMGKTFPVTSLFVFALLLFFSLGTYAQPHAEQGLKDRTKLALALMSSRLSKAEELNAKNQYPAMYNELGGFHALMDDTLEFLETAPRKDKTLDNLKRFEMTLRSFAPRLGLIRREIPTEYDHYVRSLLRYLRDARTRAIEPLFSNSVVPQRRNS